MRVIDCDGAEHPFASAEDARAWLREEEYSRFEDLLEDGELGDDVAPPTSWPPRPWPRS